MLAKFRDYHFMEKGKIHSNKLMWNHPDKFFSLLCLISQSFKIFQKLLPIEEQTEKNS